MAFDSIKTISEAEENARQKVSEASAAAQKRIAEERASCESMLKDRVEKAEAEVEKMISDAEDRAQENAKALRESTANKCAIMSVRAENKFNEAVELIIGKVVRG